MVRRSRLIVYLISGILIAILINLFLIAYNNPAQAVTSSQSKWTVTVSTTRGTIYDRNLQPLVNDTTEYKAVLSPNVNLLPLLRGNTTEESYKNIITSMKNGIPVLASLLRAVPDQSDLLCFPVKKRYGNRVLSPHIIGYCRDGVGVSGVEMAYDALLASYSGQQTVTYATDGSRQHLNGISPIITDTTRRSVGGAILTLDSEIQLIVENATDKMLSKGAVVVLDPYEGDILACASYPTFQPNNIEESINNSNGPLINRALSLYDCGSVFKIITTAAALENRFSADTEYECRGKLDIGGTIFHCHQRNGHGVLDMSQAFALSCNTYFIQLAQDLGAEALYSTANAFGFDRKISLSKEYATANPLLPTRSDLEQPAALANLSFGQGYLMTTPLHIAQIMATVVNGGKMPAVSLIRGVIDDNEKMSITEKQPSYTIISENTATLLQKMLREVVVSGTGKNAEPQLCTAAGKTGTAETGQMSANTAVVQSWFAGYFPAQSPRYVVVVLAEDSNTTKEQASTIFCEISNNLYEHLLMGDTQ